MVLFPYVAQPERISKTDKSIGLIAEPIANEVISEAKTGCVPRGVELVEMKGYLSSI